MNSNSRERRYSVTKDDEEYSNRDRGYSKYEKEQNDESINQDRHREHRYRYNKSYHYENRYNRSPSYRNEERKKYREYGRSSRPSREDRDVLNDGRCLYVYNLPKQYNEDEIKKHFNQAGEIENVNILVNPLSQEKREFCFVKYFSSEEAKEAISMFNDKDFLGNKLVVELSRRNVPRATTPGAYLGKRPYYNDREHQDRRYKSDYYRPKDKYRYSDRHESSRYRDNDYNYNYRDYKKDYSQYRDSRRENNHWNNNSRDNYDDRKYREPRRERRSPNYENDRNNRNYNNQDRAQSDLSEWKAPPQKE